MAKETKEQARKRKAAYRARNREPLREKAALAREGKTEVKRHAPFVAIDSEGESYGEPIKRDAKIYRRHKTFLWAASDETGNMVTLDGSRLKTRAIFDYLLSLDRKSTRLNSSHTDISRMPSSA